MRALARFLLVVLAVSAALLLPGAGPALAEPGDVVELFDSRVDVRPDGSFTVREQIRYAFAGSDRHGIYRTIPVRYPQPDSDLDRVIEIDDVRVSSPSGAPDEVKQGVESGQLVIRIGDPDVTIDGTQTYVIEYIVRGALNEVNGAAELAWNVTGNDWDADIARASATVVAEPAPTGTICFEGPTGSPSPCGSHRVEGRTASFGATDLARGEGLTVGVSYPLGSIDVPPPVYEERWTVRRAFSTDAVPATLAGLTLLGGLGAAGWVVWSRGRDRRYVGEVPGLAPPAGQDGPEEPKPLVGGPPVVVEFAPPPGVRPGEAGTLLDERADVLDVTATIIDLAVRGYLRIDETLEKRVLRDKRDWTLTRLRPADDDLKRYERTLFDALFAGRDTVELSALRQTFADDLQHVQKQLYTQVVEERWFRRRPDSTRSSYVLLGVLLACAGAGLTYVLARWTHFGLAGVALVVSSLVLLGAGRYMPARTARGSAAHARLLGFREYVRTAEAEQIRFEERERVFSRYLPFAIVFGETERWAKAFASLATAGAAAGATPSLAPSLYWYGASVGGWDEFGDSLRDFTTTTSGAVAAAAPSSGGSSFAGGGFSGGGFGGGGGGSW